MNKYKISWWHKASLYRLNKLVLLYGILLKKHISHFKVHLHFLTQNMENYDTYCNAGMAEPLKCM